MLEKSRNWSWKFYLFIFHSSESPTSLKEIYEIMPPVILYVLIRSKLQAGILNMVHTHQSSSLLSLQYCRKFIMVPKGIMLIPRMIHLILSHAKDNLCSVSIFWGEEISGFYIVLGLLFLTVPATIIGMPVQGQLKQYKLPYMDTMLYLQVLGDRTFTRFKVFSTLSWRC